jgi:hypothetical protein
VQPAMTARTRPTLRQRIRSTARRKRCVLA